MAFGVSAAVEGMILIGTSVAVDGHPLVVCLGVTTGIPDVEESKKSTFDTGPGMTKSNPISKLKRS